jgi:hypothetical protein
MATSVDVVTSMSCCMTYGVALHTSEWLGFDFLLTAIEYGRFQGPDGEYPVSSALDPFRVTASKLGANTLGLPTRGTLRVAGQVGGASPWEFGFCLRIDDGATSLAGTRIYVPGTSISPQDWWNRLQVYRLADLGIAPAQAASVSIESLQLASAPWLSLSEIASVERGASLVELMMSPASAGQLATELQSIPLAGSPFVVKADGAPIYLGTFMRGVSSMAPVGPSILVEDIADARFTIAAPLTGTGDPRFDPRIVKVLTEANRLLP